MKTAFLAAAGMLAAISLASAADSCGRPIPFGGDQHFISGICLDDPIENARALSAQIAANGGVAVSMGGIDTNAALRKLADAVVFLDARVKALEAKR